MNPASSDRAKFIPGLALAAAVLAGTPWTNCAAQDRAGTQVAGTYPYAASVLAAPKPIGRKNLNDPVLTTITPDIPGPAAISFPERRTALDHMLQSHEFTFPAGGRDLAGNRLTSGTNMDLDAIKLRVSRDKVLLKAEWLFN